MNVPFVKHDATGRITMTGDCPEEWLSLQAQPGETVVQGTANHLADYVLEGAIVPRPACPATLAGWTLAALPAPCTITINGTAYACADTTATLSFPQPGVYAITVSAFPYLDGHFEVTV